MIKKLIQLILRFFEVIAPILLFWRKSKAADVLPSTPAEMPAPEPVVTPEPPKEELVVEKPTEVLPPPVEEVIAAPVQNIPQDPGPIPHVEMRSMSFGGVIQDPSAVTHKKNYTMLGKAQNRMSHKLL